MGIPARPRVNCQLLVVLAVSVIVSSVIYAFVLGPEHFNGVPASATYLDFLYYSLTTQASVGYGDISPSTPLARGVVMVQLLVTLVPLVVIFTSRDTP